MSINLHDAVAARTEARTALSCILPLYVVKYALVLLPSAYASLWVSIPVRKTECTVYPLRMSPPPARISVLSRNTQRTDRPPRCAENDETLLETMQSAMTRSFTLSAQVNAEPDVAPFSSTPSFEWPPVSVNPCTSEGTFIDKHPYGTPSGEDASGQPRMTVFTDPSRATMRTRLYPTISRRRAIVLSTMPPS